MSPRINDHQRMQVKSSTSTGTTASIHTGTARRWAPQVGYSVDFGSSSRESSYGRRGASRELHLNFHQILEEPINKLLDMMGHPEQWADPDEVPPNKTSTERALKWLRQMYETTLRYRMSWVSPHIGVDENGDISFEWWRRPRKLTVYVTPTDVEYLQVSGPDIIEDMDDGLVDSPEDRRDLWAWLEEAS